MRGKASLKRSEAIVFILGVALLSSYKSVIVAKERVDVSHRQRRQPVCDDRPFKPTSPCNGLLIYVKTHYRPAVLQSKYITKHHTPDPGKKRSIQKYRGI